MCFVFQILKELKNTQVIYSSLETRSVVLNDVNKRGLRKSVPSSFNRKMKCIQLIKNIP